MFPPETVGSLGLLSGVGESLSLVWAYLDPGSGSLVFQMLIAALLSGLYFMRSSLWYLRKVLTRGLSKE